MSFTVWTITLVAYIGECSQWGKWQSQIYLESLFSIFFKVNVAIITRDDNDDVDSIALDSWICYCLNIRLC